MLSSVATKSTVSSSGLKISLMEVALGIAALQLDVPADLCCLGIKLFEESDMYA
jgi:hypothetical protein